MIACVPCNQRKGGRTPAAAGMRLASVPARPKHLPETLQLTFTSRKDVPESWLAYLRDLRYWHEELEE